MCSKQRKLHLLALSKNRISRAQGCYYVTGNQNTFVLQEITAVNVVQVLSVTGVETEAQRVYGLTPS